MAWLFGWNDILRPIRDGYRHLFPSPDTGPTSEERARQRELDRVKGFTYFDTFDQLEAWTEPDWILGRANTPLLPRVRTSRGDAASKANVLLCHDYAGNYHDYEAIQGIGVGEESYCCKYLQQVDTFVYFSHKLVCVPPPAWINTLHRNGVEVLGTVLCEPQTKDMKKLLEHDPSSPSGGFPMASKLAAIVKYYGFDGWLINLEKPFPKDVWDPQLLASFLRQLREDLGPNSRLIWVDYQNTLGRYNLPFATAAGSILTNYSWKAEQTVRAIVKADGHGIDPRNVFFGIDVWAQNETGTFVRRRVTYPEQGGGGTNTGVAVTKLAKRGLSAGIFAPAWTFEHFPGHGPALEEAVWEGTAIPDAIQCSCPNRLRSHPDNPDNPVSRSARSYPAGNDQFFYTDFVPAFAEHSPLAKKILYNGKTIHSQLSAQAIQPLPHRELERVIPDESIKCHRTYCSSTTSDDTYWVTKPNVLTSRFERPALAINAARLEAPSSSSSSSEAGDEYAVLQRFLPLFQLDMPADGSLLLSVRLKAAIPKPMQGNTIVQLYMRFAPSGLLKTLLVDPTLTGPQTLERLVQPSSIKDDAADVERLVEVGVYVSGHPDVATLPPPSPPPSPPPQQQEKQEQEQKPDAAPQFKLKLRSLLIQPLDALDWHEKCRFRNLAVERIYILDEQHEVLTWEFACDDALTTLAMQKAPRVPYSSTTGPAAYFLVKIGATGVTSRAYGLTWVLGEGVIQLIRDLDKQGKGGLELEIVAEGFDGVHLARERVVLGMQMDGQVSRPGERFVVTLRGVAAEPGV